LHPLTYSLVHSNQTVELRWAAAGVVPAADGIHQNREFRTTILDYHRNKSRVGTTLPDVTGHLLVRSGNLYARVKAQFVE